MDGLFRVLGLTLFLQPHKNVMIRQLIISLLFLQLAYGQTVKMSLSSGKTETFGGYQPLGTNTVLVSSDGSIPLTFSGSKFIASGSIFWEDGSQPIAGIPTVTTNIYFYNPITSLSPGESHQYIIWKERPGFDTVGTQADWTNGDFLGAYMLQSVLTHTYVPGSVSFDVIVNAPGFEVDTITNTITIVGSNFSEFLPDVDLSGFNAFVPPMGAYLKGENSPEISEWTRSNEPGDTMAMTIENTPVGFVAYGIGVTNDQTIALLDGQECAVTLSGSLPADEMYLMWPTNASGYGSPVAINQTEAWWVGSDIVSIGDTFSVYGRNLKAGSGVTKVWCIEESEWLTSTTNNPYKADFTVPAGWGNGTKTLWAHNGKGREYGWADSVSLTVEAAIDFAAGSTNTVAAFTEAAIETAIGASSSGDTVYFPNGTYTVNGRIDMYNEDGIRLVGESRDGVIIKAGSSFSDTALFICRESDDVAIKDITFEIASDTTSPPLYFQYNSNMTVTNCVVDTLAWTMSSSRHSTMRILNCDRLKFNDCIIYASGSQDGLYGPGSAIFVSQTEQLFFDGCTFTQINDCNATFVAYGDELSFTDCTQDSLDQTDPNEGYGWGKGRFIAMKPNDDYGASEKVYVGDCSLLRTGPREGTDPNSGEVILGESPHYIIYTDVVSASATTVILSGVGAADSECLVSIVSGKGFGQTRNVLSVSGSELTLTEPWNVDPDATSMATVFKGIERVVVYDNYFTGRDGITTWGTAEWQTPNCAVEMYTAGRDWIVDGNVINGTRNGIVEFSFMEHESAEILYSHATPCYFSYFANNVISNTYFGLVQQIRLRNNSTGQSDHPLSGGSVWRNNTISNTVNTAIWNHEISAGVPTGGMMVPSSLIQKLAIYDSNAIIDCPTAQEERYGFDNQVYVGNATNGVSWSP